MIGLPSISSSGFGVVRVSGLSRSPFPPAIRMADMGRRVDVRVMSITELIVPSLSRTGMSM